MRIVTGGTDDSKLLMNAGPPFKRFTSSDAHVKGAVHAVAYGGAVVASVGADKSVCIHDGKTLELIVRKEHVHEASIYACAWSSNDKYLLTCSADGTVKLLEVGDASLDVVHTWNVASRLGSSDKVPIGGMQLGCAFVKDDLPVTVGMNGEIIILPQPPVLGGTDAENEQVLTGHHAPIAGLAVCDGFFYTADTDGVIVQWNSETGKAIKRLRPSDDEHGMHRIHGDAAISCITVASDGTLLIVTLIAGWDDAIRITKNAVVTPNQLALDAQPNSMGASGGADDSNRLV
jgi:WD40 repeat protein